MKKRLKIAVIGLGSFGSEVVKTLFSLGHEVLAIDHQKELVQAIQPYATIAVTLDATDKEALEEAGLGNMDVCIISAGESMETTILATLYAKELGIPRVIVKAVNETHATIMKKIGADEVINPERDMAVRVAYKVASKNVFDITHFEGGFSFLEIKAPDEFTGKTLLESKIRNKYGVFVVAIKKQGDDKPVIVPNPELIIEEGDNLILLGSKEAITRFQEKFS